MVLTLFDYTSILLVLNNFIKKRFTINSSDERSHFSKGQTSKPLISTGMHLLITLCLKNVPSLACYNIYMHGSIATIFSTNVAEKAGNQTVV